MSWFISLLIVSQIRLSSRIKWFLFVTSIPPWLLFFTTEFIFDVWKKNRSALSIFFFHRNLLTTITNTTKILKGFFFVFFGLLLHMPQKIFFFLIKHFRYTTKITNVIYMPVGYVQSYSHFHIVTKTVRSHKSTEATINSHLNHLWKPKSHVLSHFQFHHHFSAL